MYSTMVSFSERRASGPTRSPARTIGAWAGSKVMSSSRTVPVELLELRLDLRGALGGLGGRLVLARLERAQALGLFGFEALDLAIQVARQLLDLLLVGALLAADLGFGVLLDGADQSGALSLVHVDHDVLGEVQDLLERCAGSCRAASRCGWACP